MTAKEQLHHLVDELGEEQAEDLLRLAASRYTVPAQRSGSLPTFVGMGDSGRTDVSQRVDEHLGDGFGR